MVLLLLRTDLMAATTFMTLHNVSAASLRIASSPHTSHKVLVAGPSQLFTQDIIRAWQHYKCGYDVAAITAFNRNHGTSVSASTGTDAVSHQAWIDGLADAPHAANELSTRQRDFARFADSAAMM